MVVSAGNTGAINLQIVSRTGGNSQDTGSVACVGKQGNKLTLATAHHVIDGNPSDCMVRATDNNGKVLWQGHTGKVAGDGKTDLAATTIDVPPEIAAKINAEQLATAGDLKAGAKATVGTEGNFTGSKLNDKAQGTVVAKGGDTFAVDPQAGGITGQGVSGGGVAVQGADGQQRLAGIVSTQTTGSNNAADVGNINAVDLTKQDNRTTLASLVQQAGGQIAANDNSVGSTCDSFGSCPKTQCGSCGSNVSLAA